METGNYFIAVSPVVVLQAVAAGYAVGCTDVSIGQIDKDCCGTFEIRDGAAVCNECGIRVVDEVRISTESIP